MAPRSEPQEIRPGEDPSLKRLRTYKLSVFPTMNLQNTLQALLTKDLISANRVAKEGTAHGPQIQTTTYALMSTRT